ncbi:MAG TPA: preprotein translocase subunit YajC [Gemmatimonadaceae bacterium]|nr:preprotein translocase subunit YajC [Gemmatimonadaceae bacterium]
MTLALPAAPLAALLALMQPSSGNAPIQMLVMYGGLAIIFYLFLIRPQQKQRKEHEELVYNLKKGDEVVTAGGIIGTVVHIKETLKDGTPTRSAEDRIIIRSEDARIAVERGRIVRVVSATGAANASGGGSAAAAK